MPSSETESSNTPLGCLTPSKEQEMGSKGKSMEDVPTKEERRPVVTFPEGGLRACLVATGSSLVLFSTFGYANAFGVFQKILCSAPTQGPELLKLLIYFTKDLITWEYFTDLIDMMSAHGDIRVSLSNKSPSTTSWIGSLQTFFMLSGMLFGGSLFDRFGTKPMWPTTALYIFSIVMTSICTAYYQFLLAQGISGGISLGMTMAPCIALTGQYFNKNRAAAMGLAVAGSSIDGVIFPIALSKMFDNPRLTFGWTIRICGFIILTTLLAASAVIRTRLPRRGRFFIPSAFKEPPYVILIGALFLIMTGLWTPFFYLPTYAISNGMSVQLASYLISIMNGSSFFGRVIPGIIGDRIGRLNMLVASALSSGILILFLQRITTNATIILFSALYGFCSEGIVNLMSVTLAQIPKNPNEIY